MLNRFEFRASFWSSKAKKSKEIQGNPRNSKEINVMCSLLAAHACIEAHTQYGACASTYTHAYTCLCANTYTCTCAHAHVRGMCACIKVHTQCCSHACTCIHMCKCIYHICMYMTCAQSSPRRHAHVFIHNNAHMHEHIHICT